MPPVPWVLANVVAGAVGGAVDVDRKRSQMIEKAGYVEVELALPSRRNAMLLIVRGVNCRSPLISW